jgi:Isochorismatase family
LPRLLWRTCSGARATRTLYTRFFSDWANAGSFFLQCSRDWIQPFSADLRKILTGLEIAPYDPLTSENAALVLIDHQVGLMTGVRDYSTDELKHNVVALAKAAKSLKLPIVVTTTARDSMWGPTFPELVEALPGIEIIDRSSVNAFDDARVASAVMATGRKKLIFAGISLEVCAAFPAITAVGKGVGRLCRSRCFGNL